ncbi:MAG: hypothetical protein VX938_00455, partial [Myxococcota bacterium]|nr:hypothetical protein [Myxococcota bacterium]
LRLESLEVVTSDGLTCEAFSPSVALVEVPVTTVGLTTVTIDPSQARLRHSIPELDGQEIEAAGLSAAACSEALDDLLVSSNWMEPVPTDGFAPEALPGRFSYEVRPDDTWVVNGSRSGFLHRQIWTVDPETGEGSCDVDSERSALATGRAYTARLAVDTYPQCPPSNGDISLDLVGDLLSEDHERFSNFSFSLDVLPGCDQDSETGALLTAIRQDTRWSFLMEGPDSPRSVSGSDMHLTPRVPVLEFRRQQVQLDSALSRILLLEIRPGSSTSLQSHF